MRAEIIDLDVEYVSRKGLRCDSDVIGEDGAFIYL